MTSPKTPDGPGEADQKRYNQICEKLVRDEDDLAGMIAYGLYKQSKREWLTKFERDEQRQASDKDEQVFVSSQTRFELERLRDRADSMLSAYASSVLQQATPSIQDEAREQYPVGRVDATLERIVGQNRWWRQVSSGILGALGYSLALLALAMVIQFVGIDLVALLKQP